MRLVVGMLSFYCICQYWNGRFCILTGQEAMRGYLKAQIENHELTGVFKYSYEGIMFYILNKDVKKYGTNRTFCRG